MKKKLVFFYFFILQNLFGWAQISIDSVKIIPASPTTNDIVSVVYFLKKGDPSYFLHNYMPIKKTGYQINIYYGTCGPILAVIDHDTISDTDTIVIGKLCPGIHTITYYSFISNDCTVSLGSITKRKENSFSVSDTNPLNLELPPVASVCENNVVLNPGSFPNASYFWNTGETTQTIAPEKNGAYTVQIFMNGCLKASDTCVVTSGCDVYFPNAFTPNKDGINDIFSAKGIDIYDFNIALYDRWGQLLHTSNNIDLCWDGNTNSTLCAQGVYYWRASYKNSEREKTITQNGSVLLMR